MDEPIEMVELSEPLTTSRACEVHAYHSPRPQVNHVHHILPQAWGGGDEWNGVSNLRVVCPTGHNNVHALLRQYAKANGKPPWAILRQYGGDERDLAEEGWRRKNA